MLSYRNHCTVHGLRFDALYPDTKYWALISSRMMNPLTVNQECYIEIIIAPFVRDLKHFCHSRNLPLRQQWMQQDGATAHTAGESLACLQQHFGDCFISHGAEFPFSSHSPDLTAPDAYIWGMLKEQARLMGIGSEAEPSQKIEEKILTLFLVITNL